MAELKLNKNISVENLRVFIAIVPIRYVVVMLWQRFRLFTCLMTGRVVWQDGNDAGF